MGFHIRILSIFECYLLVHFHCLICMLAQHFHEALPRELGCPTFFCELEEPVHLFPANIQLLLAVQVGWYFDATPTIL